MTDQIGEGGKNAMHDGNTGTPWIPIGHVENVERLAQDALGHLPPNYTRRAVLAAAGLLALLGLGGSIVLSRTNQGNKSYEFITVGRDAQGLYAEFDGKRFRIAREQFPVKKRLIDEHETLDGVLYRLNNTHNPNFQIKGDRLMLLREIFNSLNRQPGAINLEVGVERPYRFTPRPEVKVIGGDSYNFPYYDLRK